MKIVHLSILLLFLVQCNAQNINESKKAGNNQKTVNMKPFDIKRFTENKDVNGNYIFKNENGLKVVQFGYEDIGYFQYETISEEHNLIIYSEYFPSGNIKTIGNAYPNDFALGIWKYFDEKGNLVREDDFDKPYLYTWDHILVYCEKNEINIKLESTRITREVENEIPVWEISWIYHELERKTITIDGKTGEILKEKLVNLDDLRH